MCRTSQPHRSDVSRRATDPSLRAADVDRERAMEALRRHAGDGRVSLEELETRLERAAVASTLGDVDALLADLPHVGPVTDRRVAPARAAAELREHLGWYVAVNTLLVAIWALGGAGDPWFLWPLLGWGVGILAHALPVLAARPRPRPPLRA